MGETKPTTISSSVFPGTIPGYTFHNFFDLQELAALRAQLTEREADLSVMTQARNELAQQLTEKDRKIERLKKTKIGVVEDRNNMETLAYDACQERRALAEQLSASQAREREAEARANEYYDLNCKQAQRFAECESALAAARKALEFYANASYRTDGFLFMDKGERARAALNGDSHADA